MSPFEHWLSFAVATLIFAAVPGPAILYTAAQTLARGRRGGGLASAGIHLGGLVHVVAAAAGLAALLEMIPDLYLMLRMAGAGYLVWLGVGMIRRRFDAEMLPEVRGQDAHRAFAESVLVEALNPKAALFYVAFLPQFIDFEASWPAWAQFLALGWIVNLTFSTADLVTVTLTTRLLSGLRRSARASQSLRRVGGGTLIGLGVNLAVSRQ